VGPAGNAILHDLIWLGNGLMQPQKRALRRPFYCSVPFYGAWRRPRPATG